MVPPGAESANTFEAVVTRRRESPEVSVYNAIESLTHAGDAMAFVAHDLIDMLDRGMTFGELLELIESRMETLSTA
jgi:methionine aminopeptidase